MVTDSVHNVSYYCCFIVAILFYYSVSTYSLYISKLTNTYWVSAVYQVLRYFLEDRKKFKK